MAGSIFIPLVSVFDAKGIRQAQSSMQGLTVVMKSLKASAAAAAVSFATVGAGKFIKEATAAARDLDRNLVGLNGVFENLTPTMAQFTKEAKDIGLSQVDAARASTFLGSVLKQSGFEMGTVAKETKNLVGLASDLAATYGYDVSEALTGMTALFRGEYDPIEKFGVAMKQAEVNALLLERGQNKLTGALLRNAQAQARLDLLYARSTDAQGAYAKQSGSLFVAQKNLAASFDNLQAQVGTALQQPLATLLDSLTPLVESMGTRLTPIFETFSKVVQVLTPLIEPLTETFMLLVDAFTPLQELLVDLIQPLMVPLVSIVKLLNTNLKTLVPSIKFVADILNFILVPVFTVLALALDTVIKLANDLITQLSNLPIVGWVMGLTGGLKGMTSGYTDLNNELLKVDASADSLVNTLSKPIKSNPLEVARKQAEDTKKSLEGVADAMNDLIDDARGVQKDLIGAFDITSVLENNQNSIVESVTFVNGQFKVITSSLSKGTQNLASAFQNNLTKLKKFYSNIQALNKTNLDPELIQQIVSAGPDAGNATAEAILASGKDGVKALNTTFTDIRRVSGNIGAKIAKQMKAVGTRMGNGLIDGMVAQRDKLVDQARVIGEEMGAALGGALTDESNRLGIQNLKNTINTLNPAFTGSYIAGVKSGTDINSLTGSDRPTLMSSYQITNPFARGTGEYQGFEKARKEAINYNISVNVAPGASGREVGKALVLAIQEYERTAGKVFTR